MTDRAVKTFKPKQHRLETPTDLGSNATKDIAIALNALLADTFALFLKTKNFHWHVGGPHFRDYHLLFDEQAVEILAMTDQIADACANWADARFDQSAKLRVVSAWKITTPLT